MKIKIIMKEKEFGFRDILIPNIEIEANYCARYVRILAKKIFDLNYIGADAWNFGYHNKIILKINNNYELNLAIKKNLVNSGSIILFENKKSKYFNILDEKNQKIIGTHLVLFLGLDEFNSPIFAELLGNKKLISKISDFEDKKLYAKIVFYNI